MKNVVIQTDFGTGSMSVAAMHGVCYTVDNALNVENGNNDVHPFDVLDASASLVYQIPYWPKETVFISVVDPGVGTKRKACVAKLYDGHYVVTPDNGTLTYLKELGWVEAIREIDESVNRLAGSEGVNIFHGRDVFAYCGARLAAGVIDYEGVGPEYPTDEIVMAEFIRPGIKDGAVYGMICEASEHFGLIDTNTPFELLKEAGMEYWDDVDVIIEDGDKKVFEKVMKLAPTFGDVKVGEDLILQSESKTVMFAINLGNAVTEYGIGFGPTWKLTVKKA